MEEQAEPKVSRIANIYDDFEPWPWPVGPVSIYYDEDGEAVGFYLSTKSDIENGTNVYGTEIDPSCRNWLGRTSLPDEIFNHQFKELDVDDAKAVALFMSEFGMIYDSYNKTALDMEEYCRFVNVKRYGPPSIDSISTKISDLDSWSNPGGFGRAATRNLWIEEYRRLWDDLEPFANKDDSVFYYVNTNEFTITKNNWEPKLLLVSYEEVRENIDMLNLMVNLAKAFTKTDVVSEIEDIMDIGKGFFFDEAVWLDNSLNGLLAGTTPKIGFIYNNIEEEQVPSYVVGDWDVKRDSHTEGSFMRAVALQIRNFNLHLAEARVCEECNEIFIVKQTKRATKRAHSDSQFCCDKCKNRNTQRKHRETPGYKQKHPTKKKTSTPAESAE